MRDGKSSIEISSTSVIQPDKIPFPGPGQPTGPDPGDNPDGTTYVDIHTAEVSGYVGYTPASQAALRVPSLPSPTTVSSDGPLGHIDGAYGVFSGDSQGTPYFEISFVYSGGNLTNKWTDLVFTLDQSHVSVLQNGNSVSELGNDLWNAIAAGGSPLSPDNGNYSDTITSDLFYTLQNDFGFDPDSTGVYSDARDSVLALHPKIPITADNHAYPIAPPAHGGVSSAHVQAAETHATYMDPHSSGFQIST